VLGASGLGTFLLTLAGCGDGAEKSTLASAAPKAVKVKVAAVERRVVERSINVVGTLKGWEDVIVGSKKEGRVKRVLHDMGDRVPPGELIVELEAVDADLAVLQAERKLQAELAKLGLRELPSHEFDVSAVPSVVKARVAVEKARQNLAREQSLMRKNAGTMQDFQNAENDERGAEASLADSILAVQSTLANAQAAKVALDVARQARLDLEIRAPIPSLNPIDVTDAPVYAVAKRSVAEGQMLKQGDAVMELVIERPLRLWTNAPERFSADVRLDQDVRVDVASFRNVSFEGKVARINPSVDPATRTFQVEVVVANNRGLLRPGGFAKASILIDKRSEATVVPPESIYEFAGVTKVFVVAGDRSHAVPVQKGLEGPGWVEVIGAFPADSNVVVEGQSQLAEGTLVEIRAPEASEEETEKRQLPVPSEAPRPAPTS
jgi:RND family efflux transporter MFP subunit